LFAGRKGGTSIPVFPIAKGGDGGKGGKKKISVYMDNGESGPKPAKKGKNGKPYSPAVERRNTKKKKEGKGKGQIVRLGRMTFTGSKKKGNRRGIQGSGISPEVREKRRKKKGANICF